MALRDLWLYPPIAVGRVGNSAVPLECFLWGPNDVTPRGTGKTTIIPYKTLVIADNGTVSSYMPDRVCFKDEQGFRRVCPFFEVWGAWEDDNGSSVEGPITETVLKTHGLSLEQVRWQVTVANLKAYNMTQDEQTRIDAEVDIRGDDVTPHELCGMAPAGATVPLVPHGSYVPLGHIRLTRPNQEFPELRLRFLPGFGKFYGPTNLKERWQVNLPDDVLFLNPDSSWASWTPLSDDARGTPGGQYAQDDNGVSYGMVDDVCDGIITCTIGALVAYARITVGPPDYAPDRRHLISLADGLKDRVDRASVYPEMHPGYYQDPALTEAEIQELFQRIYETAALNNVDVFNNRVSIQENPSTAIQKGLPLTPGEYQPFRPPLALEGRPLPLSDLARQTHRRLAPVDILKDLFRKRPEIFAQWIRPPLDPSPFFDRRMAPVMRGPAGAPLHLTRRQYVFLKNWIKSLQQDRDSGQSQGDMA